MSIKQWIRDWLGISETQPYQNRRGMNLSPNAFMGISGDSSILTFEPFKPAEVADNTIPEGIAMDSNPVANSSITNITAYNVPDTAKVQFLGYGTLSLIAQDPLIRAVVETTADEMVRKFVEFTSSKENDEDESDDRLKVLIDECDKYKVAKMLREAAATAGYMGGAVLYIDLEGVNTEDNEGSEELKKKLRIDGHKIGKGELKGFNLIEPVYCYPKTYNSTNPLARDFYKPERWFVMGKEVHGSRLMRFVQHEPPVLMRPAYNFFGIPMAQMILDFVERFTDSRKAAAEIVKKFSLNVLKTDMSQILQEGGTEDAKTLKARAAMFKLLRDNDGLMMLDKEDEDFVQINTPFSGVHEIVTKQLEYLAAVARMPAVKLLGISPSGFNTTGESDIRNHYDNIRTNQEKMFAEHLDTIIRILQLNKWGKIYDDLTYEFVSLYETNEEEEANIRKTDGDRDVQYIDRGVISPEEVRGRLANDPRSGYNNIDVDDVPELDDYDDDNAAAKLLEGIMPNTETQSVA